MCIWAGATEDAATLVSPQVGRAESREDKAREQTHKKSLGPGARTEKHQRWKGDGGTCGRQDSGPPRRAGPNPGTCDAGTSHGKRGFVDVIK